MKYKVFFHELGLKARVNKGRVWLDSAGLHIEGQEGFTISSDDIAAARLLRSRTGLRVWKMVRITRTSNMVALAGQFLE
jgi:hypothetical protein